MPITREAFLSDAEGSTLANALEDPRIPFEAVLGFFGNAERQQRLEDAEIHHDRAPLAGVVRELEAQPGIHQFFAALDRRRSARLRRAIGVIVRMIMEHRGWQATGKKGCLGVRGDAEVRSPYCNTRGLALWFATGDRYRRESGTPFLSVRERREGLEATAFPEVAAAAPARQDDVSREAES